MRLANQNNNLNGSSNPGYPYNTNSLGNNFNASSSLGGRVISHSPQPHSGVNYHIGNGSYNLNKNYQ